MNSTFGFDFDHITVICNLQVILHQPRDISSIGSTHCGNMTSFRFSR